MPTKRSNTYRKIRTGPRGGKYILKGGQKRYLSGGQACAMGGKGRCKKSKIDDGQCDFNPPTKRCRKKKAKKKPKQFNNEHLIDTFVIDFNGSNLSFFKELLKTKKLTIDYNYDQFIIQGTIVSIKDGYDDIETFIGSNLSKFTSLTELSLVSRFMYETSFEWIKERPPKLKKLSILHLHFLYDIPSFLTKGLDILEIRYSDDLSYYVREDETKEHKKIKKVIFTKKDDVTEEELRLLRKYFPDSKIIFDQQAF